MNVICCLSVSGLYNVGPRLYQASFLYIVKKLVALFMEI